MKKKELIKNLKKSKLDSVIIKVEGGLFLPIVDIVEFENSIILIARDVTQEVNHG